MKKISSKDFFDNEYYRFIRKVVNFYKENNIDLWAHSGTLLGIVRDGGFIAWDDDMDFGISEKNFSRTRSKLYKWSKKNNFIVLDPIKNRQEDIVRIISKETYMVKWGKEYKRTPLILDIMITKPMNNWNFSRIEMVSKIKTAHRTTASVFRFRYKNGKSMNIKIESKFSFWKRVIFHSIFFTTFIHTYKLRKETKTKKDTGVEMIVYNLSARDTVFTFNDQIFLNFYEIKILVPDSYESLLKASYGDWKKIPKKEERVPLHSETYFLKEDNKYNKLIRKGSGISNYLKEFFYMYRKRI